MGGRVASPPAEQSSVWVGRAELALWEGRHDQAATAVAEGLRWIAEPAPRASPRNCRAGAMHPPYGWRPTGPIRRPPEGGPTTLPQPDGGPRQ